MQTKNCLQRYFILLLLFLLPMISLANQRHAETTLYQAVISPDSQYIIVTAKNSPALVWHAEQHRLIYTWKNSKNDKSPIRYAAFSADSQYAITAEAHNIAVWNLNTGEPIAYWLVDETIRATALGRNGHYALVGFENGKAIYIDTHHGLGVRYLLQKGPITSIDLSQNGRYAITGSDDHTAILWNVQTGQPIYRFKHQHPLILVFISPKNNYVLTSAQSENTKLWDLKTGKLIREFDHGTQSISAANFSSSETYLALAVPPKYIGVWETQTGKLQQQIKLTTSGFLAADTIQAVAFNHNEKQLLIEDSNGNYQQYHLLK